MAVLLRLKPVITYDFSLFVSTLNLRRHGLEVKKNQPRPGISDVQWRQAISRKDYGSRSHPLNRRHINYTVDLNPAPNKVIGPDDFFEMACNIPGGLCLTNRLSELVNRILSAAPDWSGRKGGPAY